MKTHKIAGDLAMNSESHWPLQEQSHGLSPSSRSLRLWECLKVSGESRWKKTYRGKLRLMGKIKDTEIWWPPIFLTIKYRLRKSSQTLALRLLLKVPECCFCWDECFECLKTGWFARDSKLWTNLDERIWSCLPPNWELLDVRVREKWADAASRWNCDQAAKTAVGKVHRKHFGVLSWYCSSIKSVFWADWLQQNDHCQFLFEWFSTIALTDS